MRSRCCAALLIVAIAVAPSLSAAAECCDTGGCTICKPKWEDKKTKKPEYSQKCADECVRGLDAWCDHGCCPEDTPPCAGIFTRKKLYKRETDKVERVLKYDLVEAPAPCSGPHACRHRGPAGYDLRGLVCRCLGP